MSNNSSIFYTRNWRLVKRRNCAWRAIGKRKWQWFCTNIVFLFKDTYSSCMILRTYVHTVLYVCIVKYVPVYRGLCTCMPKTWGFATQSHFTQGSTLQKLCIHHFAVFNLWYTLFDAYWKQIAIFFDASFRAFRCIGRT